MLFLELDVILEMLKPFLSVVTRCVRMHMKNLIWKICRSRRDLYLIIALEVILIVLLASVGLMMTEPLDIQLTGEGEMTLFCGDTFEDPGAVASARGKAVDVTRTGAVDTQAPGTYTLTYTAKYLLTSRTVHRTVQVVKVEPSVVELLGENEMTVQVGTTFVEPGFRATDCTGRDVTDQVRVSGSVDTGRCGSYELTYSVTDRAGNVTTVRRTVVVEPVKQPDVVNPDGKVIYLTFDDGPSAYTQQLLDVLAKYNAKATFFVVNNGRSNAGNLMRAMVAGGHAVAIHSLTHDYGKIYASEEAFLEDLHGMQKLIQRETGVLTTLMRFPGGSSNTISKKYCAGIMSKLVNRVTEQGFQYFDWNVDSNDAGGAKTAEEVYQNVISGVTGRKYSVVLQHDLKSYSVEAVEKILQWGLANGYSFQALTPESPACHHGVNN